MAADFEKKYPKVKINLVSERSGDKHYTALSNAISAEKGVPDVAQVEYFALGQYALTKGLTDLAPFGADKLASKYSPGPWNAVSEDKAVYGLPMDAGPMALFYNKRSSTSTRSRCRPPGTSTSRRPASCTRPTPRSSSPPMPATRASPPVSCGRPALAPYKVDGTDVKINFADASAKKYTDTWQKLIDEKLSRPSTAGPTTGTRVWATAPSPPCPAAPGCPPTSSPACRRPRVTGARPRCRPGPRVTRRAPRTAAAP
ncbi:hypothetical protein SALBM311S_04860 [Streptomyces alboniger]